MIVTGAGDKAFVAGADIAEMRELDAARRRSAFAELGGALGDAIEALDDAGDRGGQRLRARRRLRARARLRLHLRRATTAKFGQPEVNLGVIPGFGGTQRLARRVGVAQAQGAVLHRRHRSTPTEALRIGLVDAVCRAGRADGQGAASSPAGSPRTARSPSPRCKRLVHAGPVDDARRTRSRSSSAAFGLLFATADQREGMAAFLAKPRRAAQFKGQ